MSYLLSAGKSRTSGRVASATDTNQVAGRLITYNLTIINLALALTYFLLTFLMDLLFWGSGVLNIAHLPTGWINPLLSGASFIHLLPVCYITYWHFGYIIAGLSTGSCFWLYRRTQARRHLILLLFNLAITGFAIAIRIIPS